jgi:hypothetical protein
VQGSISLRHRVRTSWGVKPSTQLQSVPTFITRGAIPPLPQDIFMTSCLVTHREKFYFTLRNSSFCYEGHLKSYVDSPYYSGSELCGGAVTVSVTKYLPWQAMHFLQRSTHFSKTCCRPLVTSKFLDLKLPFHGWKSPEIAWGEIWTVWRGGCSNGVPPVHFFQAEHRIQFRSRPMRFRDFSNHETGAPNFEVINSKQHVFEKWVERCRKYIASYQRRYFEKKRPSPHLHLHKVPNRRNKASPRTFQTALVDLRFSRL